MAVCFYAIFTTAIDPRPLLGKDRGTWISGFGAPGSSDFAGRLRSGEKVSRRFLLSWDRRKAGYLTDAEPRRWSGMDRGGDDLLPAREVHLHA